MSRRRERANANANAAPDWVGPLTTAGLIAITFAYCIYFYDDPQRKGIWSYLFLPDDIAVASWGGDWKFFGVLDRAPIFLWAGGILAAATAVGRGVLRGLRLQGTFPRWELNVYAIAIGLAGLSWAMLLIGRAGLLQQWALLTLPLAALAMVGGALFVRDFVAWNRQPPESRIARGTLLIGSVFTVLLLSRAVLPALDFDVLEYHLQAPKEWLQAGRIEFLPHNLYASMPLGAEMLALLAMATWPGVDGWFFGALVGKLLIACFVPLTGLAIYGLAARVFNSDVGAVGGTLFVTLPWMILTGVEGLNEPAVAAFGFFAFAALVRGEEHTAGRTILAGLFAGAAVACKYPALVMIAAPLTIVVVVVPRLRGDALRPSLAALFLVAATVSAGPWFLKNAIDTGNPTYPLLASVFESKTRTPEKDAQFSRAHAVPKDEHGSRYGVEPIKTAFAQLFMTSPGQSPLLPLAFLTGAAVVIFSRLSPDKHVVARGSLAMVGVILLVWFAATHRIDRFWLPAAPFAALVGGMAILRVWNPWERWAATAFVASGLVYLALAATVATGDSRRLVRLEQLRDGEALLENDPPRVSAAFRYLNERTPPGAAVLCVGDAAVFDLVPRVFYNTCFDDSLLAEWMENKDPRDELLRRKIHFVCVNYHELDRYRSPGNYGYDPRFRDELIDELVAKRILELEWTEPVPEGIKPAAFRPTKIFRVIAAPTGD